MSPKSKQDLAVGFGEATAENPPYPAQQHLDAVSSAKEGEPTRHGDDGDGDGGAPAHGAAVDKIKAWVDKHPEDAQDYLDAENGKSNPRSSLVEHLESVIDAE